MASNLLAHHVGVLEGPAWCGASVRKVIVAAPT
jgi:hypothetical protein